MKTRVVKPSKRRSQVVMCLCFQTKQWSVGEMKKRG
jgi:hypothetical protein